ncbi:hypothetical protein SAMN05443662_0628 [Sulfurivirga caldicuralii]|uniref:Uncharacterized protein n=2 Tax=Sulfurivirga caldicuralii TaxID=364032 RepID=A0A1N6EJ16_9GAMM|nr:hypothetical protein SAMN05443662_0628 [Sulfurivirga caldicuralii]
MEVGRVKLHKAQSGSALIVLVLGMSIGMLVWFGVSGFNSLLETKRLYEDIRTQQLLEIKSALLAGSLFVPEVYQSNADKQLKPYQIIPGIGYLPCPANESGVWDGAPCGNPRQGYISSSNPGDSHTGITALGYVPLALKNRNQFFAQVLRKAEYRYILDERFVAFNQCYYDEGTEYLPYPVNYLLKITSPPAPVSSCGGSALPLTNGSLPVPFLSVDNRTGYVALLIDPGADLQLAPENVDGDDYFTHKDNDDIIVGIHFGEWSEVVSQRWVNERRYWKSFNNENGWPWAYDKASNPVGQEWALN